MAKFFSFKEMQNLLTIFHHVIAKQLAWTETNL